MANPEQPLRWSERSVTRIGKPYEVGRKISGFEAPLSISSTGTGYTANELLSTRRFDDMAVDDRSYIDAKLEGVEARLDAKVVRIESSVESIARSVQEIQSQGKELRADNKELKNQFQTESRSTRRTVIGTGLTVVGLAFAAMGLFYQTFLWGVDSRFEAASQDRKINALLIQAVSQKTESPAEESAEEPAEPTKR